MNNAWIVITPFFYVQVLDSETWSLVFKDPLSTPSPLYTLAPLEHGAVSGDEDGTVKIWDFRLTSFFYLTLTLSETCFLKASFWK